MTKDALIGYADKLGYTVDRRLKEDTIIRNILKIVEDRKSDATRINAESLKATVTDDDRGITVRFFNMETAGADLEFAYSGKRGMFGPNNPNGHRKCPTYHLFPGEEVKLAYSVYEHLSGLTFVTHKAQWDSVTGMIKGNIPIIKPRFILQPIFSKEDLLKINN